MTKTLKDLCVGLSVVATLATATLNAAPPEASPPRLGKTESELIANLASSDQLTVVNAMTRLKKVALHSPNAIAAVKKLLTDPRIKVRERAAGWLGSSHATVNEEEVKAVCALLKESDANANAEGLKSLRGLQGPAVAGTVPEVLPFLKNPSTHLVRDACRTLAVIGNKDIIPKIEPLLTHSESAVRKDAQDAIYLLKSKP